MKLKRLIALVLSFVSAFALVSCGGNSQDKYEGLAKVVYHLEGGTYKNSSEALTHYYSVEGGSTLIVAPETINENLYPIEKSGYVIEGWYKVKTGEGENATYSEKWDFSYDKVDENGVTLYAKWKKDIEFKYVIYYKDENGNLVKINSESEYVVDVGEKFKDIFDFAKERKGYTFLGRYETEDGEPWDSTFVHPGDEENPIVKVVAVYLPIKGDFNIVTTKEELIAATNSAKDIYLDGDIDLEGEEFTFNSLKNKRLIGNGHTISNFTLKVSLDRNSQVTSPDDENAQAICVSLLGNLEKSTVSDVNFTNFTVSLDQSYPTFLKNLYFAPLAVTIKDSVVSNVTISGAINYLVNSFNGLENAVIITDSAYYKLVGEDNQIENVTVNVQVNVDGE